jgi:hypothetical protein
MMKIIAGATGVWLLAGAAILLPGMAPEAPTGSAIVTTNALAKSDRLDIRHYGSDCSQRGWPYYETNCIRDMTAGNRAAKPVRMIALDRFAAND